MPHPLHPHYWQKIPGIGTILFVLGLIGGVALRLTIFLEPLGKHLLDFVWFSGVIAYTIFYAVRISIENHRREICSVELFRRLKANQLLPEDISTLHEMLMSHCRSKVKYNYQAWLLISLVSLLGAAWIR